jgi:hypothetical protein
MKSKNKAFIFILGISLLTLVVLVIGSIIFAKDSSLVFSGDGYIITSSSERQYFKSGTTYKENLEHKYAFKNESNDDVIVELDSFIHYNDKSLGFMKNGVIMDLNSANMSIVPYYNITNKSTISYDNGKYVISTANKKLEFDDILGRISEDKYIVAGKNITLKLPEVITVVEGEYFEITFVEDGVVKIENQEVSYQTTAQGTYIYVGDKVVIDLGGMKVIYDGEATMSLSQMTIDGNENIDVLEDDEAVKPSDNDSSDDNADNSTNNGGDNSTNNSTNNDVNTGSDDNQTGNSDDKSDTTDNDTIKNGNYIELIEASTGTNKITASFKYNDTSSIEGNLILSITDISTGNKVYSKVLDKTKSTDSVVVESLSPDTNYLMTIYSSNDDTSIQYFGQSFRTEELGITLRKVYSSSSSLSYKIDYEDNTGIKSVTLSLYDENMKQVGSSLVSNYDDNEELTFSNLDSNTSYTVKVDSIVMDSFNYVNVYNIERTDITLKKVPDGSSMNMEVKTSKSKATLMVSDVTDEDNSIKSYTFKVYSANYDGEGNNRVLYSKVVNDLEDTTLASFKLDISDLSEEDRKLGYYRFSVDITYYDNEKTMTLSNQQISSAFYLTEESKEEDDEDTIRIDFEQDYDNTTYSSIAGTIKISDSGHKILVNGRDGYQEDTRFTIKYYSGDISTINSTSIVVTSKDIDSDGNIVKNINLTGLTYNSGYIIEVYADMYDDDKNVINNIVDRSFSGTTKSDVDKLKFNFSKDNGSDDVNVINFEGLITTTNAESTDSLAKVTAKLYKGSVVEVGNQIGETIVIEGSEIFNKNYNFTNNSFGIKDVLELTSVSGGNLYQNYTIQLTNAYYVSGNMTEVENNTYTYTISLAYMLEKQLDEPTIVVSPIKNGTSDSSLDKSTIIGYEVTAGAAIEKLKEMLGTTGIESINYYIYKVTDDGEELIKTVQSDQLSTELYFEGINEYNRGGKYVFKYDISIAGLTEKYPTHPVESEVVTPEKQSPFLTMYKSYSTEDSIVYKYKFTDIDDAIHTEDDGGYKFYYSLNESDKYLTKELVIDEDYQELTIDGLSLDDSYSINYYKETVDGEPILTEIEEDTFESLQDIEDYDVEYSLQYSSNDNRLAIKMEDNSFLERIILYEVTIKDKSGSVEDYVKVFNVNDLKSCPSGGSNCLIIDYADIEEFLGKDTSVNVQVYYDNGLIGIDNNSEYGFVFVDSDGKYLNIGSDNSVTVDSYSSSLYDFSYQDDVISINDYFDSEISSDIELTYLSNGISYGKNGVFDPKAVSYSTINCSDNYFRFDSIIPKVSTNDGVRTISKITVGVKFSGLTVEGLKNQFKSEDSSYYVYVDLYDDSDCSNKVAEDKIKITVSDSSENGYKVGSVEFTDLMPASTYYYKLYAYLKQNDGSYQRIELFDASDSSGYTNSIYKIATRGVSEIFGTVAAYYDGTTKDNQSSGYDDGRTFKIQYRAKSYQNYTLKIQLFGSDSEVDYFKTIKLDASNSLLGEDKIVNIKSDSTWVYLLLDDNFVFGDDYYTLVLTAISDNSENSELELYRAKLTTTSNQSSSNYSKVNVAELVDPSFNIVPSTNAKGDINVIITPVDTNKVIINPLGDMSASRGYYNVRLVDSANKTVAELSDVIGKSSVSADKSVNLDFSKEKFNLESDTYYYIYIDTYIYKNNYSLIGTSQPSSFRVSKIVYTSSSSGVSLGSVSSSSTNNSITLTYTGASMMDQIDRVIYSISVDGGTALVTSKTLDKSSSKAIFTTSGTNYSLTFDGLKLSTGNTYLVEIGYYHKNDNGTYEQLFSGNIPYTVAK